MSGIIPPKLLSIEVTQSQDDAVWTLGDPSDAWYGYAYRWRLEFTVSAATHSSPDTPTPFYYTGLDIAVGDWISTSLDGFALQIVSVISQDDTNLVVIAEDIDRFNTFSDPYQGGSGGLTTGPGYLFTVNAEGEPILVGLIPGLLSANFQTDLITRFEYRNTFTRYVRVDQPGHTFVVGDLIRIDLTGGFEKVAVDTRVTEAIGIVNSINIPTPDWFTFRPMGTVLNDVNPPLVGSYGDIFYADPSNPGKVTSTKPTTNALGVYMRLDTPNRALLLQHGLGVNSISGNSSSGVNGTNKYDVTNVTAGQTIFTMPNDATEVLYMAINGVENESFTFDATSKVLTFDPAGAGYGVDATDEVFFIYKS